MPAVTRNQTIALGLGGIAILGLLIWLLGGEDEKPLPLPAVPSGQAIELPPAAPAPAAAPEPAAAPTPAPAAAPAPPGRLRALPEMLAFQTILGTPALPQSVALLNAGGSPVAISAARPTGDAGLAVTGACPLVAPGDVCQLRVSWEPQRAGAVSAGILVLHDAEPRLLEIRVSALAVAPPAPAAAARNPYAELAAQARADRALAGGDFLARSAPGTPAEVFDLAQGGVLVRQRLTRGAADLPAHGVPVNYSNGPEPWRGPVGTDYGDYPSVTSSYPVDRCRIITSDRYIGATLQDSINSQVGGRVIAKVNRPVFGADCRDVLIPSGSSLVGDYQGLSRTGDSRLAITFRRIILPNGAHLVISEGAADQMGRAGIPGEVDQKILETLGYALLYTIIPTSLAIASGLADDGLTVANVGGVSVVRPDPTAQALRQGSASLQQSLGQASGTLLQRSLNLSPVTTIAQGTEILVTPRTDLVIKAPPSARAGSPVVGVIGAVPVAATGTDPSRAAAPGQATDNGRQPVPLTRPAAPATTAAAAPAPLPGQPTPATRTVPIGVDPGIAGRYGQTVTIQP